MSGVAQGKLYPLPLMALRRLPRRGRARERARRRPTLDQWLNVAISVLNVPYGYSHASVLVPTAAQHKGMDSLMSPLSRFLREAARCGVCREAKAKHILHVDSDPHEAFAYVVPLDDRAGVLGKVATVDTVKILRRHDKALARLAKNPKYLLRKFDGPLPRPFIRVPKGYDKLVLKNLNVKLQRMVRTRKVFHHLGKPGI